MILLIFSIILIPFLFKEYFIFPLFSQKYFIYILLLNLTFIRTFYAGPKKYNIKALIVSLTSLLIFVFSALLKPSILDLFYPNRMTDAIQFKASISLTILITNGLFIFIGLVSLGYLIYNFIIFPWDKYILYRFIEGGIGIFCLLFPFYPSKSYIMIFTVVTVTIIVHLVYLALWLFIKIMEPIKVRKLARIREEILAKHPDSPLKLR